MFYCLEQNKDKWTNEILKILHYTSNNSYEKPHIIVSIVLKILLKVEPVNIYDTILSVRRILNCSLGSVHNKLINHSELLARN